MFKKTIKGNENLSIRLIARKEKFSNSICVNLYQRVNAFDDWAESFIQMDYKQIKKLHELLEVIIKKEQCMTTDEILDEYDKFMTTFKKACIEAEITEEQAFKFINSMNKRGKNV